MTLTGTASAVALEAATKPYFQYLTDDFSRWETLIDASPQGTVLCRSWLLQAISADVRLLGYFQGNRLLAGIPLYFERVLGVRICRMPQLVHTWGVVMEPIAGKRVSAISREMEILRAFAKVLAKERIFVQSFHPTVSNWLPFHWEGFTQVLRFGYVFDDLTDLDMIWSGMERSLRRAIHKAERSGITVVPCESSVVVSLTEKSFRHQRMQLPFGREYFERICQAAKRNDAGECFAAVDMDGKAHAALFLVWDHKRAYSLVGGTDPETRASGANCLLFWHVIKFAASRANMFDFAGTMLEPNEMFVRSFGARLVPYNQIRHMPRMLAAISSLLGSPGMSRLTRLSSDHLHED